MKKYLLILSIILFSCLNPYTKENNDYIRSFCGKKLYLPLYKNSCKLKIVTHIDGTCSVCTDNLLKWKDWIKRYSTNIDFLFYFYSYDKSMMNYIDNNIIKMNYPLIFDVEKSFLKKNNLPVDNKMFQTFLLNSENKVILMGNPLYSNELAKLYKREINKRSKKDS